ncbi:PREDICTED: uncharacterized protein LOC104596980 [Nelumbo nucifera]|uniref:Uncharacterized protein LOC104596980 n=2 Tax=Nelumbo nucifera TaxID=4432 RepID=A0A1U8A4C8_NELNU|nr:PREDICTED: uncharacterized protein LOC104596980 [Nelumbo nucifera]XP_010256627.1 PREDICTED: uncharacterized protein LOC104596980 [Nelumbo nucifera]XP_010256628.1 PREDICTED: uncharacterized protein LOC104596980 [Nelumbo nucifera]DAD26655.1 TPA_asm: hypothetical protein HUJ06_028123 [Nelumbo nucifera]
MESSKKLKRVYSFNNLIIFICVVVSVSCLLVVLISMLRLPEVSRESNAAWRSYRALKMGDVSEKKRLGQLGEIMVGMLPDDLAFTVFVPSEEAFERDLRLWANKSLLEQNVNDTQSTLSRLLGFSAVPRSLPSVAIPLGEEVYFDSISGFTLYISRDPEKRIVANRVRSESVDLRKGKIVVHIMNGVIMDNEFEQSVRPDYESED